jgi:putative endonuclease
VASKEYYVYMMTNKTNRVLYTGVTNNLERRVFEHKNKSVPGFSSRYNAIKLVYFECCGDVLAAIGQEKRIKGWLRVKKNALVETMNPEWKDLAGGWYGDSSASPQNDKRIK